MNFEVVRDDGNGEQVVALLPQWHFGQLWDFAVRDIAMSVAVISLTHNTTLTERGQFVVRANHDGITISMRDETSVSIKWFMREIAQKGV